MLRLLQASATPQDFVVFKVDVDNSDVELSIVEAIAASPELANLVDELFFEYHFDFERTRFDANTIYIC